MTVHIKRIYDEISPDDGKRILVDRLWPRGISKVSAELDLWPKALTPSTDLRRWYHQDEAMASRWVEFKQRYLQEIQPHQAELEQLRAWEKEEPLTLLTAAKHMDKNHAHILKALILNTSLEI